MKSLSFNGLIHHQALVRFGEVGEVYDLNYIDHAGSF